MRKFITITKIQEGTDVTVIANGEKVAVDLYSDLGKLDRFFNSGHVLIWCYRMEDRSSIKSYRDKVAKMQGK